MWLVRVPPRQQNWAASVFFIVWMGYSQVLWAAKPEWYGSGRGPATFAANRRVANSQVGSFHPHFSSEQYRQASSWQTREQWRTRGRIALPTDREPKQPRFRYKWLNCAFALVERLADVYSLTGEPGPVETIDGIVAVEEPLLASYRYPLQPELRFEAPEVMLTFLHWVGALRISHAGTTAPIARVFGYAKDRRHKAMKKVLSRQALAPVPASVETFDFPMSGNALGHFEFDRWHREMWRTPKRSANTLLNYFDKRKGDHPGIPSVAVGFSAGAAFASLPELQTRALDGAVLVGPVIPGISAGYEDSRKNLFKLADALFIPNWEAFHWADHVISQMDWADKAVPFTKPTLILVGENDTDVPERTVAWLREQAQRFPYAHFYQIPNAPHNVLKGAVLRDQHGNKTGEYDPTEAYALVEIFLRKYFTQTGRTDPTIMLPPSI